jgi:hypothetical protein
VAFSQCPVTVDSTVNPIATQQQASEACRFLERNLGRYALDTTSPLHACRTAATQGGIALATPATTVRQILNRIHALLLTYTIGDRKRDTLPLGSCRLIRSSRIHSNRFGSHTFRAWPTLSLACDAMTGQRAPDVFGERDGLKCRGHTR